MRFLGIVFGLFVLTACQTGPASFAEVNSNASWSERPAVTEGRRCIKEFGYKFGTPEYGQCVRQLANDRVNNAIAGMGYSMQLLQAGQPRVLGASPNQGTAVLPNGSVNIQGAGYLRSQRSSGQWRFCSYQKLTETTTIRIPNTQICPQVN